MHHIWDVNCPGKEVSIRLSSCGEKFENWNMYVWHVSHRNMSHVRLTFVPQNMTNVYPTCVWHVYLHNSWVHMSHTGVSGKKLLQTRKFVNYRCQWHIKAFRYMRIFSWYYPIFYHKYNMTHVPKSLHRPPPPIIRLVLLSWVFVCITMQILLYTQHLRALHVMVWLSLPFISQLIRAGNKILSPNKASLK